MYFYRDAKKGQQREAGAKPGADGGGDGKQPGVQGELRNAGEEGRQVAAHRQPCAEPGDDAARHGLRNADPAAWQAQFDVIRPQRGGQAAAEHADDHPAIDAGQRRPFEMYQLVIAPLFAVDAQQLQQLTTPAGEFAGHRPEGAGDAKIVGRENARGNDRRDRRPEPDKPGLFEGLPCHKNASELRRY